MKWVKLGEYRIDLEGGTHYYPKERKAWLRVGGESLEISLNDLANLDNLHFPATSQLPAPTAEPVKGERFYIERDGRYKALLDHKTEYCVLVRSDELKTHVSFEWLCDRLNGKPEGGGE